MLGGISNPFRFLIHLGFVGYLQARGVGIGQISKHVSLARKINNYLASGSEDISQEYQHSERMEAWLAKLLAQLHAAIPVKRKLDYPDITVTWEWVEKLVTCALDLIDTEVTADGCIGYQTARLVQIALIAALVTGCYCPPPRIHVILSLMHPRFVGRISCQDKDCMNGEECKGNHIELIKIREESGATESWNHFQYQVTDIRFHTLHHKTDRYDYSITIRP